LAGPTGRKKEEGRGRFAGVQTNGKKNSFGKVFFQSGAKHKTEDPTTP